MYLFVVDSNLLSELRYLDKQVELEGFSLFVEMGMRVATLVNGQKLRYRFYNIIAVSLSALYAVISYVSFRAGFKSAFGVKIR